MVDDDELLNALGAALHEPEREPPADRVQALRARASRGGVTPRRPQRRRALLVAAAIIVAVGALGAGLGIARWGDGPSGEVEFAGALTGPDAEAEATVRLTGIGRVVRLETDELAVLPTGEFYELWFVAPDDRPEMRNRISAGTFHPNQDGRTSVQLAAAVNPANYPIISVTAEPGDGDPAPTGPEVLRATITP